jgi:hypothetical protein
LEGAAMYNTPNKTQYISKHDVDSGTGKTNKVLS